MNRNEAIAYGKEQLEIFGGQHHEFILIALRSLQAWDSVLRALEHWIKMIETHGGNDFSRLAYEDTVHLIKCLLREVDEDER